MRFKRLKAFQLFKKVGTENSAEQKDYFVIHPAFFLFEKKIKNKIQKHLSNLRYL